MRLNVPEKFEKAVVTSAKQLKKAEGLRREARINSEEARGTIFEIIANYGETIAKQPKFYINVPNSTQVIEVLNITKTLLDTKALREKYPNVMKEFEYTQPETRITVKEMTRNDDNC